MFLGPHRTCVAPRAGCVDILGRRSNVPSVAEEIAGMARDGEARYTRDDGNTVGRDGPRKDVNVLGIVRCCSRTSRFGGFTVLRMF